MTRSGFCSNIIIWALVASRNLALVRTGTRPSHLLLEIRVQTFLWIELWAIPQGLPLVVAGQVEQLNLIFPLSCPSLHDLAMVYPQIIQNQEHLFPGILDQSSQEFNQLFRIKCIINNHPACLALIGHGGNHGKLFPGAPYGHRHRGLARRGKASTAHIGIDQRRFISAPSCLARCSIPGYSPSSHACTASGLCS